MTQIPESTATRLDRLADILDEACVTATVDATGLSELLDEGRRLLNELSQALALSSADRSDPDLIAATVRARRSHAALVGVLRTEMDHLSRELARLSIGTAATSSYISGSAPVAPLLDKVG